ncbi:MAG TPA: tetratricopeptide repeat protein, partial [Kiloniellaceae bacterium]|nr:tetratricopeptide repeat protein [Kiloniellaceae bacterium]
MVRTTLLLAATLIGLGLQPSCSVADDAWAAGTAGSGIEAFEKGDYERALAIWRTEADNGDREAAFQVGYLYDTGKGVPEDNALAASWYSKAAVLGHPFGQFNLAAMFANGDGVVRDRVLAYMLFDLAADRDADGARERDLLASEMTPLEIARANRLTRLARQGDMAALLTQIEKNAFSNADGPTSNNWSIWSETDRIAMAQRALAELGYDPGPADGVK